MKINGKYWQLEVFVCYLQIAPECECVYVYVTHKDPFEAHVPLLSNHIYQLHRSCYNLRTKQEAEMLFLRYLII